MATTPDDDMLREAARARGFRLVRSRRRKPGGDFGRYGLVGIDSGRKCLGFGDDGLTATADEVHSYLRGGEVAAWKRSLIGVVGSALEPKAPPPDPNPPARPERSRGAPAPKSERPDAKAEPSDRPAEEAKVVASTPRGRPSTSLRTSGEGDLSPKPIKPSGPPKSVKSPNPKPAEPTIREATRRDAAALAKLLGIPAPALAERLAAAIRTDEPPLVADADGLVGCCAWTISATLQHGARGRITLLFVAEDERRRGTGAKLTEAAQQRLAEAGVSTVEMDLDIDFDAPTGFLRRTGWQRTTNGYGKDLV